MDKILNLVTPSAIESKAVVPMGYVKIPVSFLAGYNENEEHLIFTGGKVIVASENLKISDSKDGAKLEEIISNNSILKDCFFHRESDGEYCIAFNKYELINLHPSALTENIVVDLQNLFDEFCALKHLGTDVNIKSNFSNATLNFDLCDSFPPNLETLKLNRTSVSGDISKLGNSTKLTILALSQTSVSGDISKLGNLTKLTNLDVSQTSVSGDISKLGNLTKLTNLDVSQTSVSGDISKLGNLTKLTNLALGQTSVSGDIESFVQAQRAAGRSSASLTGSSINWGEVTFDGSLTKGGLSWTSTTITMNGKTINA